MADIIRFPQERRIPVVDDYRRKPAVILVLPVIRIERNASWSGDVEARRRRAIKALIRAEIAAGDHEIGAVDRFEDIMAVMVAQFMGDV